MMSKPPTGSTLPQWHRLPLASLRILPKPVLRDGQVIRFVARFKEPLQVDEKRYEAGKEYLIASVTVQSYAPFLVQGVIEGQLLVLALHREEEEQVR